jgi:hypothetical protein
MENYYSYDYEYERFQHCPYAQYQLLVMARDWTGIEDEYHGEEIPKRSGCQHCPASPICYFGPNFDYIVSIED